MLEAMGGPYRAKGHMRAPGNMSKAKRKAFVAPLVWEWLECECVGIPASRELGDYRVHGSESCAIHAKVEGNFPADQERPS